MHSNTGELCEWRLCWQQLQANAKTNTKKKLALNNTVTLVMLGILGGLPTFTLLKTVYQRPSYYLFRYYVLKLCRKHNQC